MNSTLKNLFIFVIGGAAGAAIARHLLKTKYEQLAQEEIDSVKAVFSKKKTKPVEYTDAETSNEPDEDKEINGVEYAKKHYDKKLNDYKYVNYSDIGSKSQPSTDMDNNEKEDNAPYVIPPDEFGEIDDYDTISLSYYADGVLADDKTDEIIEDVVNTVGIESLNSFGKYEDDSVFVRNDRLKTDFEILLDLRRYSDTVNRFLHPTED